MNRTLFLSYARDIDRALVSVVASAAEKAGFTVIKDFEMSLGGDIGEEVQSAIHRADGLIALLDRPSANVIFELGFAMGAGKDVVLVADASVAIPSDMAAIPYVRLVGDEARDRITITNVLGRLGDSEATRERKFGRIEPLELAECYRRPDRLVALEPRRFEELVAELFKNMGYEVAFREGNMFGCDFILRKQEAFGTSVYLVEVKKMNRQGRVSLDHVHRLLEATLAARAKAGLLVSSSGFTSSALALANASQSKIALLTLGDLLDVVSKNESLDKQMFSSDTPLDN